MISRDECIKLILEHCPDFLPQWEEYLDYWKDEVDKLGACSVMAEFSHFVERLIIDNKRDDLPKIFGLVERLMIEGDDEVQTAVATCFVENLVNYAAQGLIDKNSFLQFLGPESLDFVHAYDARMDEIERMEVERLKRDNRQKGKW